MKILLVSNMYPSKKYPSTGTFVERFCEEVEGLGISVTKSIMYKSSHKTEKVVRYLVFYANTFIKMIMGRYDVVYIHYASHSSPPVLWARKLKSCCIYTNVHGSDVVPENKRQERFQKYTAQILAESQRIIVPSEYFKSYVIKKYRIDREKITVYPSAGVNPQIFQKRSEKEVEGYRKKWKIDRNKKTFSYVGRITEGKGWKTYLEAVKQLQEKHYEANFVVVGSGNQEKEFHESMKQLGLSAIIKKYPLLPQGDLAEIYNLSDTLIFPTEREGESLGLVAIEAMACGTPVIGSDFAAPGCYIKNGYNGLKFKKGEAGELAEKIELFLTETYEKDMFAEGTVQTAYDYLEEQTVGVLKEIFNMKEGKK